MATVKGAFTIEENIRALVAAGTCVCESSAGSEGKLLGPFGKMGKCRVCTRM
jgi:hypothetical protein